MAEQWKISGTYFEACNCEMACPCVFTNAPTDGDCKLLVGWHIEKGALEKVALDGLNVVMAAYSPGHMMQTKWQVALYLDDKASDAQKDALTRIFAGQVGGVPAALAGFIGQVLGVSSKKLVYQANGRKRSLEIEGVARSEIEAIEGQGGAEVTLNNVPFTAVPGYPAVQSKSKRVSYKDHGFSWEFSGKNGFYSPFMYEAG
jgi:hypothetical protein